MRRSNIAFLAEELICDLLAMYKAMCAQKGKEAVSQRLHD